MEIQELSPSKIEGISYLLFDLDGTLVDMDDKFRLPLILRGMKRFAPYIYPWKFPASLYRAIKAVQKNQTDLYNHDVFCEILFKSFRKGRKEDLAQVLENILNHDFVRSGIHFSACPGASETLKIAEKLRLPLILATNPMFPLRAVEFRLKCGGFEGYPFSYITHSQNSTRCKPRVSYYRELIRNLGLDPQKCLMIGNDPIKDLPAAEIGMKVFLLDGPKFQKNISKYHRYPFMQGDHRKLQELLSLLL